MQKAYQEAQKTRRVSYFSVEVMEAKRAFTAPLGANRPYLPLKKGNRRPPRGPGHVQHSLQSAAMSLPICLGGGSYPSPGLGYCIQQMTRLERDLQGMLNTLKIGGDGRWRQGRLVWEWAKKTSPFAGLVGMAATASASQTTCSTAAKLFLSSSPRCGISKRLPSTSVISSRWSPSHWAFSATFWTTNSRGPRSVCTSQ